jgi:hypothetical protein
VKTFHAQLIGLAAVAFALQGLTGVSASKASQPVELAEGEVNFVAVGTSVSDVPVVRRADPGADWTRTRWTPAAGKPTLLLVFSSHCPSCQQVLASWREMRAAFASDDAQALPFDLQLLGMSAPEDVAQFLSANAFPGELFAADPLGGDDAVRALVRFDAVPQTVLIDGAGRVVRSRVGAFEPDELLSWIGSVHELLEAR